MYAKAVKFSIGYNPRSLKRYLNSFSLINYLKAIEDSDTDDNGDDFMLFAILGIQISYPKIFRLLTQKQNFLEWNKGFGNKFGIEWDEIQEKIKKFGESELIDEEWEQIVWGACQSDSYLKARAFSVLELLNLIRDKFKDNLEEELENAMNFASITSVDDDVETKQAFQKVGNKTIYDGIDSKLLQLKEIGYSDEAIQNYRVLWEPLFNALSDNSKFKISLAKTGASFNDISKPKKRDQQLLYSWNPSKKTQATKFWVKHNTGKVNSLYKQLVETYNLADNEHIQVDKNYGLVCDPKLYVDLGNQYHNFIKDILTVVLQ